MDDLEVIRLAVADIIAKERIARKGMEVKGKFGKGGESVKSGLLSRFFPSRSYGWPQERGSETAVSKRRLEQVSPDSAFWSSEIEQRGVKPRAIREECVAAEMRHCRLQMKTAGNGNGEDFIVVRRKNGGELADAFGVAALGEADKKLSADAKNVATFECAGKRNRFELSKLGDGLSE